MFAWKRSTFPLLLQVAWKISSLADMPIKVEQSLIFAMIRQKIWRYNNQNYGNFLNLCPNPCSIISRPLSMSLDFCSKFLICLRNLSKIGGLRDFRTKYEPISVWRQVRLSQIWQAHLKHCYLIIAKLKFKNENHDYKQYIVLLVSESISSTWNSSFMIGRGSTFQLYV